MTPGPTALNHPSPFGLGAGGSSATLQGSRPERASGAVFLWISVLTISVLTMDVVAPVIIEKIGCESYDALTVPSISQKAEVLFSKRSPREGNPFDGLDS